MRHKKLRYRDRVNRPRKREQELPAFLASESRNDISISRGGSPSRNTHGRDSASGGMFELHRGRKTNRSSILFWIFVAAALSISTFHWVYGASSFIEQTIYLPPMQSMQSTPTLHRIDDFPRQTSIKERDISRDIEDVSAAEGQTSLLIDLDAEVSPDHGDKFMSKELVVGGCNDDWSNHLWSGGKAIDTSEPTASTITRVQRIEICVAYCHADLQWIREAMANEFPKQVAINLTIMSKCNNEADIPDFGGLSNVKVEVIQLPNKGGCDLAFVHFITRYLSRESPVQSSASSSSTALLFLKDTENIRPDGRLRSLEELLRLVLQRDDFVCSLEPHCWTSAYHDVKTLGHFMKNSYTRSGGGPEVGGVQFNPDGYHDLSDFLDRELDWTFPNDDAIQVCYGGQFAITESRLFNGNRAAMESLFRRLERVLMEGPAVMSAAEHFVERLWAGILAKPLTPSQVKEILALHEFVLQEDGAHMGPFASENIQGCCKNSDWKDQNSDWIDHYWGSLNSKAQEAAKLLGFNEEIWDSDSPVPIYSTTFEELTHDKMKAVEYLGLRTYFA